MTRGIMPCPPYSENDPMKPMPNPTDTEHEHRIKDLANAAALTARAAGNVEADTLSVSTPYGQAVVHLDGEGADVQLSEGATVHVRFDA